MRKRFVQQMSLNLIPIGQLHINLKSRDAPTKIALALMKIYKTPAYNEALFEILERYILKGKKNTGRPGMDLWQIFVMAQFRLGLNLSYDRLHHMCIYDSMLRTLLGVETTGFNTEKYEFAYQNILDNVGLLSDELLKEINTLIVSFGHDVFKKKEKASLSLKTDSYVVESNVHFPTDYNLLWDSLRKCTNLVDKITTKHPQIRGWRKLKSWKREFKNSSRRIGQISGRGGKNKLNNLQEEVHLYTQKATEFLRKLETSIHSFPLLTSTDMIELEKYIGFTVKLVDLLQRRVLKGKVIKHEEKLFSIFETYTEWINKGKRNPNVELGKMLAITTDEFNLLVDYRIMEKQADSEIVIDIAADILQKYKVKSWSFDKGYWHPANKELLKCEVENVVMPSVIKWRKKKSILHNSKNVGISTVP